MHLHGTALRQGRSPLQPFCLIATVKRWLVFLIVLVVTLSIQVQPTWAEGSPETATPVVPQELPASKPSGLEADNISSEKISQFVAAYLQVVDLMERREGELQGAETDSESLRVRQEIETEAFAIIETAGLTWQEYLQLLGLANTDPEFGERIAAQLQEATYSSNCC